MLKIIIKRNYKVTGIHCSPLYHILDNNVRWLLVHTERQITQDLFTFLNIITKCIMLFILIFMILWNNRNPKSVYDSKNIIFERCLICFTATKDLVNNPGRLLPESTLWGINILAATYYLTIWKKNNWCLILSCDQSKVSFLDTDSFSQKKLAGTSKGIPNILNW